MNINKRNFINLSDIKKKELNKILNRAVSLKKSRIKTRSFKNSLYGVNLAMIFEKPSTRTRVSFEIAIKELGGQAIILDESTTHLARGETVADTARVLDRYCQAFMIRTNNHHKLLEYESYANAPIINGLSNLSHPCQVMADIMAYEENRGKILKKKVTWMGDLNNVLYSWVEASNIFGFNLYIAHPKQVRLNADLKKISKGKKNVIFTQDIKEAVNNSNCVITDTWFSMGSKMNNLSEKYFMKYQVNKKNLKGAHEKYAFLHCLPAKRGKEVSGEIIDDNKISIVWDAAENRLHVQKAILEWCLKKI
ncbi:MAG: ornithine carbamoyltransferase [Pelagibacterales bacterium]|nr:ornithine carbamoyltransferase [Pelagibacterales bacterium]OUU63249.1 MAG: ornithine carbamoyltransferase [Alphaproteobacteria bacterium TMED62]